LLGRLGARVGSDAKPRDDDERKREQPDEEPVREGACDDPAADLAVPVDHLVHRVD
jgi:hypothetical protein